MQNLNTLESANSALIRSFVLSPGNGYMQMFSARLRYLIIN